MKSLDVVKLRVKYGPDEKLLCIEVLCVPFICSPLSNQEVSVAYERYPVLKDLVLADYDHDSSQFHVGALIGLDHYHSFFTGHVIKTNEGPVPNETILGWVLSEPISSTEKSSHTNFYTTSHVMHCSFEACPANTDDTLRKDLDKFWAVDNVAGSDECVIHQFEKEIAFNGERYVTKLPFRPDHRELSDNLEICKVV